LDLFIAQHLLATGSETGKGFNLSALYFLLKEGNCAWNTVPMFALLTEFESYLVGIRDLNSPLFFDRICVADGTEMVKED